MRTTPVVERYADAERFLAAAQPWLERNEAENSLILGIAMGWRGRSADGGDEPYWAAVRDGGRIVGCACRTPPRSLLLSRLPASAIGPLVAEVSAVFPALDGINGPVAEAEAFASCWAARRGGRWETRMRLKLHGLTEVTLAAATPPGALRAAALPDAALARAWIDAYVADAGLDPAAGSVAERLIRHGQLFLWVDGDEPRSMAATARETPSSCSINGVYTPPHHRNRGYATATVAALSRALLAGGRKFLTLYTDVTNPTSNSIYAKIGYRPIRDEAEIALEP